VEKVSINDSLEEMVRKIRANGGPPSTPAKGGRTIDDIMKHASSEPISDEELEEFLRIIYEDRRRSRGEFVPYPPPKYVGHTSQSYTEGAVHDDEISLDDSLEEMVRKIRAMGDLPSRPPRGRGTIEEILQDVDPDPVSEEEALEFVRMIYADRSEAGKALPPE
jgi:hypothetical protein